MPSPPAPSVPALDGIDHDLIRDAATWQRKNTSAKKSDENVFSMMRRIGKAKAGRPRTTPRSWPADQARSSSAKHVTSWTSPKRRCRRGIQYASIRGDQTKSVRQKQIDAFVNDPDVAIAVCSLTAAGVGINLQVASNLVLAELSWDGRGADPGDRPESPHRPDRAGHRVAIIAAQTIDTKIAELIDSKAGLAARALDGQLTR